MRTESGGRPLRKAISTALAATSFTALCACGSAAPPRALPHSGLRSDVRLVGDSAGPPVQVPGSSETGAEGRNIGEMLGFVEGEYITRGSVTRALGPREPTQDEAEYERSIRNKVKDRARQRVFVHAAELMGLQVPPDLLDRYVEADRKAKVDDATKKLGRPVTFAEILAQKGQSLEEYRQEISDGLLEHNYRRAVREGLPGKRPQVDTEPSPADLRRVYAAHRDEFDDKAGARLAWWTLQPLDYLDDGKRTYEQAVEEARRRADAVAAASRAGQAREKIAADFALPAEKGNFATEVVSREDFDVGIHRLFSWRTDPSKLAAIEDWAFDPARRPPEAQVFDTPNAGFAVIAVLATRAAQAKTFEQVQEEVAKRIRAIRNGRVETQHFLELLQHATIWPAGLAAELEVDSRRVLKQLDTDPRVRDIWLR